MIIVQAPLRTSLFGGGTDFPGYYLEHGGCVLSSAIDKYIFVTIKRRFDKKLRVGWTHTELVDSVDELHHELIREAFRLTGIDHGVEITTMGDIPSEGSGLGSSSTVTVGALHAMYTMQRELVVAERLAAEACHIEIDVLGKPIGIQDQYIAAYGGLRFMEFMPGNGEVRSTRIELDPATKRQLNHNLLLFYTGVTRKADSILAEQQSNIRSRESVLEEMKHVARVACDKLQQGDMDAIGDLLHDSWLLKKQLASKISNSEVDDLYELARRAGATGGKIAGAGGGGFLLLYCPPGRQEHLRRELHMLQELPFNLGQDGSKVIFDYQR
ncbi:putative kinase [Candidatus Promineifilum breve]|uniref:Kinase n=1 Tax=Candidatus Promineifilum breve TaxID=1806508 RepID=A0A160T357_9CHLR|nr:GHMP kinase [Candidatus Promineifilum breve]CUS03398.2 putative kinase [Candidatus Promineifilum breve]